VREDREIGRLWAVRNWDLWYEMTRKRSYDARRGEEKRREERISERRKREEERTG
jgi:hypothetical protein